MKKPNISGAAIAGFFVNNGEKMVLGLMIFVLLLFLYGAITAKPLDDSKSPDAISAQSKEATNRINEVPWEDAPPEEKEKARPIDFKKLIAEDRQEVSLAKLQQSHDLDPRLFPELTKRGDPEIYPVGELQVASGYAVIPFARGNAAGGQAAAGGQTARIPPTAAVPGVRAPGAETKGVYYTILTGIVPFEKEELEYKRLFEYAVKPTKIGGQTSQGSETDTPKYFFFQAVRAEVTDAAEQNPKWVSLDWLVRVPDTADSGKKDADKWAVPYEEFVSPACVFPPTTLENSSVKFYVTWPLPPVFLKYWGLEAAHPKVALYKPEGAGGAAEEPETPAESDTLVNPFGIILGAKAASPPSGAGPGPAGRKGPATGAPKAGVGAAGRPGGAGHSAASASSAGQYRLFRFIDTTAESGKTYRYRVRLILANPNYGLKPEDLEKPESAKDQWRLSPWSEDSRVVTVPSAAKILADSLIVPRGGADPQGKIYILTLLKDEKTGDWVEVAKDFELPLGGYASFKDVKIENVTDMAADDVHTVVAPSISADQAMLLDVRNDEALGVSKSKGPTEMLFIDSAGRIRIANSAADGLALKDYQQRTTVTPEKAPER